MIPSIHNFCLQSCEFLCCIVINFNWLIKSFCNKSSSVLPEQSTSVASERVFSTSGDILSAERSCLDEDALDAMIFLKKNATGTSVFYIWFWMKYFTWCGKHSPRSKRLLHLSIIKSKPCLLCVFCVYSISYDISNIDQFVSIQISYRSFWTIHSPSARFRGPIDGDSKRSLLLFSRTSNQLRMRIAVILILRMRSYWNGEFSFEFDTILNILTHLSVFRRCAV